MSSYQLWIKTDNRWEQDLGLMTNFYNSFTPLEGHPMLCFIACTVDFHYNGSAIDMEEALRKAWVEIRYKFPAIAAHFVGSKKIYEPANDETSSAWLASSFRVHCDNIIDNVFRKLYYSSYITLKFNPLSNQLTVTTAHTNVDGRGILYLLRAFFSKLAMPGTFSFSDEHSRLPLTEAHSWDGQ